MATIVNQETSNCVICYEDFTKSVRAKIECPACNIKTCRQCVRSYLLTSTEHPHCFNCKNRWELDFLTTATLKSFINGDYKTHRTQLLFEHEKSRVPETIPAVENYKKVEQLKNDRVVLKQQITDMKTTIRQLQNQHYILNENITNYSKGECKSDRREFKRACPNGDCLGFLSTAWKCGVCNHWACSKCFEVKGIHKDEPHECDPNTLASAQLLKKETKPCPSCASAIYKIEGCDQMWCTQCHIAFSWKTGLRVNGVIHNPHFYHWQNNGGGTAPIQTPGAVLCGGMPGWIGMRTVIQKVSREIYPNIPKEQHVDITVLQMMYRGAMHFQHWVLNRLREQCQNVSDNTELRIKYIVKEISEQELKQKLIRRDKIKNKRRAVLEIYELLNVVFIESFRDIYEWLQQNLDNGIKSTGDEKNTFNTTILELFRKNKERIEKVRLYSNCELKKISILYSQTVSIIKDDYETIGVKY